MAVTVNGVLAQEMVDGYTETADIQGGYGCRKAYICDWSLRFQFIHGVLGLSSTSHTGGSISFLLPMAYPELAAESTNSLASCYARSVEVYGCGPPTQGAHNIAYPFAKVYVTFGAFPWTFSGIDFFQLDPTHPYIWAEQQIDFSAEYITVPGKNVYAGGNKLDQDWGFMSPLADLTITLKQVPYLPSSAVLNGLQSPINSVSYLQCNAGFLMFKGCKTSEAWSTDGTITRDASFAFSYRPIAQWDQIYTASGWAQVTSDAMGSTPVIARSDLSTIIPAAYHA